jgi:hypothetical protein
MQEIDHDCFVAGKSGTCVEAPYRQFDNSENLPTRSGPCHAAENRTLPLNLRPSPGIPATQRVFPVFSEDVHPNLQAQIRAGSTASAAA